MQALAPASRKPVRLYQPPASAALARVLVPGFLGYFVLFLPVVGGMWGYGWLRNRAADRLRMGTLLTFGGAYLLATLFGWISISASSDLMSWSGAWGQGTALWMQQILGAMGSLIIILTLLLTAGLLLIDRDIQRTMDRIENGIGAMQVAWRNRAANRKIRKEEAAKEAAIEKKRAETEKLEAARQRETE